MVHKNFPEFETSCKNVNVDHLGAAVADEIMRYANNHFDKQNGMDSIYEIFFDTVFQDTGVRPKAATKDSITGSQLPTIYRQSIQSGRGDKPFVKAIFFWFSDICKHPAYAEAVQTKLKELEELEELEKAAQVSASTVPPSLPSDILKIVSSGSLLAKWQRRIDDIITRNLEQYQKHGAEKLFDEFVAENNCGFWLLTAGPGSGKTTLMSALAQCYQAEHKCVSFFFGKDRQSQADDFYQYIFLWLNSKFDTATFLYEGSVEKSGQKLQHLLFHLAETEQISLQHPLIILIDGLDEISNRNVYTDKTRNPLGLEFLLPDGVFFGYSLRLKSDEDNKKQVKEYSPYSDFSLRLELTEGHRDVVKSYVTTVCQNNAFILPFHDHTKLPGGCNSSIDFVAFLCERAKYNFMILKCVLHEEQYWLGGGKGIELTGKLVDYFEGHLERMRGDEVAGAAIYAVLFFAFREKISKFCFDRLIVGAVKNTSKSDSLLNEWTAQGLIERTILNQNDWYGVYHKTYREFLETAEKDYDQATFSSEFSGYLIGDAPVTQTLEKILTKDADIQSEWLSFSILLTIKFGQYQDLRIILSDIGTWKMAIKSEHGLAMILNGLGYIRPASDKLEDFRKVYVDLAKLLESWCNAGLLQKPNPDRWEGTNFSLREIRNLAMGAVEDRDEAGALYFGKFLVRGNA